MFNSRKIIWVIICLGIIFRVTQFLYDRSLWIDEANISGAILGSFSDIFNPYVTDPDYLSHWKPSSPLGFFVIAKLFVLLFGNTEYALRLFPLLCGIISLFLFYSVAKRYIRPKAVPIAMVIFAVSDSLIYYSSEVHSYSSDVTIALLLLLIADYIQSKNTNFFRFLLFGIAGGIAVWFSNPSILFLAGIGTSLFLFSFIKKDWTKVGKLSVAYLLWSACFLFYYFIYVSNIEKGAIVAQWNHEGAFMPFPPLSISDIGWFIRTFFTIFANPTFKFIQDGSMTAIGGIAAFAFIVGCISMFSEKKEKLFILISPTLFTLLASGLYLYPFLNRTILFIVPTFMLLIAEGAGEIKDKTAGSSRIIGILFVFLLLSYPVLSAANHLIKPIVREEIKPVLHYIKKNWQPGDTMYLHYGSKPAFKYYKEKYNFREGDYIVGAYAGDKNDFYAFSVDNFNEFTADLDKLRGKKRVWILFAHLPTLRAGIKDESFFKYYLNNIGTKLDYFKTVDSTVYLYDLSD